MTETGNTPAASGPAAFSPTAPGRFWVLRNGRPAGNMVRSQAGTAAEGESERFRRSVVQIVDAHTGELVATLIAGKVLPTPAEYAAGGAR
jgi:hypothetical protein